MKKSLILSLALTLSVGLWAIDGVHYIDADGKEKTVNNVTEVTNASSQVTWTAGWYVVIGTDVTLSKGAVCNGAVHLILADGAKLTATGGEEQAGIQVSGEGNSLTIYGQTAQSGQLITNGGKYAAGIGSESEGSGSNITINGGIIEATGGTSAAGIGGGRYGDGSNITINGGTIVAIGTKGNLMLFEGSGAGIGGGYGGVGDGITINGGTITAIGGKNASGIGGGDDGDGSDIKVNVNLLVIADGNNPPTTVITNTGEDLASSLKDKQYVTIEGNVLGHGTKGNPFRIYTYDDLLKFSKIIAGGDQGLCARLEADIDATGSNTSWQPIGNQSKVYTGTFNGNGYKISNLKANDPNLNGMGLFGKLGSGAEVYGVGIVDGSFVGRIHVGAICGDFAGGSIHDCYVYNTFIKGSESCLGGIVGSCFHSSVLRDCYVRLKDDCNTDSVGIVCGDVFGKILDCYYISDSDKDSISIYKKKQYTPAIIKVTRVSVADAKSGKLCNMLNHYGSNGSHWYQNLSTNADQYPVVNFKHGIVEWDGNKFINRSRENVEITYTTNNAEPVNLRGGFGASELMGNYVTVSKEGKMSGTIVCDQPITAIDAYAFASDSMLKTITLPNSLGMIGDNAFSNCSGLAKITLGENIIFIGVEAFKSCSALKNVYLYSVQPPQCSNNAFESGTAIHVIDASLYKEAEGWKSLNIVGDANMMKAYKAKKKSELVQAAGASKESDIPAEVRSKYNEYASSIDNATTVAAIEAVCVNGTAELQKMVQLPKWKDKGGIKINY